MKQHFFSRSKAIAAILTITIVTSVSVGNPSRALPKEEKAATAAAEAGTQETNRLVQQLIRDRMVDEVKGFTIEKRQDLLFINGARQTAAVASKYLSNIKQKDISVQVFPFAERVKMHPDANILQLVLPATFSSPCVKTEPRKDGC